LICGYRDTSLIDYPGKIASVVFTCGCNLYCPYCHNPDLVEKINTKMVLMQISKNKLIEGVVITGGEPTIHDTRLLDFILSLKTFGLSVKLDTNGMRPDILSQALDLVDYVAMDVKTVPLLYYKLGGDPYNISHSINLIMDRAKDYEFRTTAMYPFVSEENIKCIGHWIIGAKRYVIQEARMDKVLDPSFPMTPLSRQEIFHLCQDVEPYVKEVEMR
jgi:pyruvate formate lyase activating enzyme